MRNRYAFKKKKWIFLAGALDSLGYMFRRPPSKTALTPRKILVVRLDQIGDCVQCLPLIDSLKVSFPMAEIDVLASPAGEAVFRRCSSVRSILVWNCPWFTAGRSEAAPEKEIRRAIRAENYDCAFDPRGDIRVIRLLRSSGVRTIVGYGATGGGFLLNVEPEWDPSLPVIERNLRLCEAIGGRAEISEPRLTSGRTDESSTPKPAGKFRLAVHPDAGSAAKRWPWKNFSELINRVALEKEVWVDLIGKDADLGERIAREVRVSFGNLMGKTDMDGLLRVLEKSDAILSNDSGPAHIMAALGKPVWILWSGTADPFVWKPRGNSRVLQNPVDCAPCSLSECPVPGHPCMEGISVENAFRFVEKNIESVKR